MGLWGVFPSLLSLPLVAANHTVGELATQLVVSIAANGIGNRMAPREVPRKGPVSIFPRAIRHETTLSRFMNRSSRGDPWLNTWITGKLLRVRSASLGLCGAGEGLTDAANRGAAVLNCQAVSQQERRLCGSALFKAGAIILGRRDGHRVVFDDLRALRAKIGSARISNARRTS